MADERIILASASPRRRELLAAIYPHFDVVPCPLPEPADKPAARTPEEWAGELAEFKAAAVAALPFAYRRWVLGADTIVACNGQILGKPRNRAEAGKMLEVQARNVGVVWTAIHLQRGGPGGERYQSRVASRVWMRDDAAERAAYLASGDWDGKAGAYGIQNVGDRLVTRLEGSFSNVVGLPLAETVDLLRRAGLPVRAPPPEKWSPHTPAGPETAPPAG